MVRKIRMRSRRKTRRKTRRKSRRKSRRKTGRSAASYVHQRGGNQIGGLEYNLNIIRKNEDGVSREDIDKSILNLTETNAPNGEYLLYHRYDDELSEMRNIKTNIEDIKGQLGGHLRGMYSLENLRNHTLFGKELYNIAASGEVMSRDVINLLDNLKSN